MQEKQETPRTAEHSKMFQKENGPATIEELQRDETFRNFFTTTVIEVPEQMRHVTGGILLDEEEQKEKKKKKGFWPWSRRKEEPEEQPEELQEEAAEEAAPAQTPEKAEAPDDTLELPSLIDFEEEAPPAAAPVQPEATVQPESPAKQEAPAPAVEQKPVSKPAAPAKKVQPQVTTEELLSRIATLGGAGAQPAPAPQPKKAEAEKPAVAPELKPETPVVQPVVEAEAKAELQEEDITPAMKRLREQTAYAAEQKARTDAMLAELYGHVGKKPEEPEVPAPAITLVEEPAPEQPPQDADTATVEIDLTRIQQETPAEPDITMTGEIRLTMDSDTQEIRLPLPEEELFAPAQEEEPAEAAPVWAQAEDAEADTREIPTDATGEIRLEEEEITREVVLEESPAEESADQPEAEDRVRTFAAEEETEAEEPEERKDLRTRFQGVLGVLGLTETEEPEEDAEEDAPEAEDGEPEEKQPAEEPEAAQEYTNPEDAPAIQELLADRCRKLTLKTVLAGILAAALILLDVGVLSAAVGVEPQSAPAVWLVIHLVLLALAAALDGKALLQGLQSLLPGNQPAAAVLPALAAAGAALQLAAALVLQKSFDPASHTIFAGAAALLIFAGLLGRLLAARANRDGFAVMTSGVDHAAAYRLNDRRLAQDLCEGMEENDPAVLLSRPDTLLTGYVAQCDTPHYSDNRAVLLGRVLLVASVVGLFITLVRSGGMVAAAGVMAGILCMGAPAGAVLLRGVTTLLMQRAAGRVGAVVPGWPSVEKLGEVDVLQVDAADLFPAVCAHLDGVKTFQRERIDVAILYATSVLIAGCSTLRGLFSGMIENRTEILYPVHDLEKRPGRGFVAWCDSCRVVLGNRDLMKEEGIPLPAMDYENRYSKDGASQVLYLAVSGKLYAMFLYGYNGTKQVARTLGVLRRENIRLLVTADDPALTAARIEEIYRLRPGFVKVLDAYECERLTPAVGYLPATNGCMAHLGGFASVVGGLRAAAGAESAQHSGCTVQTVAVALSVVIGLLLSVTGGLAGISLGAVLLYQLAWSALSVGVAAAKKY